MIILFFNIKTIAITRPAIPPATAPTITSIIRPSVKLSVAKAREEALRANGDFMGSAIEAALASRLKSAEGIAEAVDAATVRAAADESIRFRLFFINFFLHLAVAKNCTKANRPIPQKHYFRL